LNFILVRVQKSDHGPSTPPRRSTFTPGCPQRSLAYPAYLGTLENFKVRKCYQKCVQNHRPSPKKARFFFLGSVLMVGAIVKTPLRTLLFIRTVCSFSLGSVGTKLWSMRLSVLRCGRGRLHRIASLSEIDFYSNSCWCSEILCQFSSSSNSSCRNAVTAFGSNNNFGKLLTIMYGAMFAEVATRFERLVAISTAKWALNGVHSGMLFPFCLRLEHAVAVFIGAYVQLLLFKNLEMEKRK
jgi:hypothetical protein